MKRKKAKMGAEKMDNLKMLLKGARRELSRTGKIVPKVICGFAEGLALADVRELPQEETRQFMTAAGAMFAQEWEGKTVDPLPDWMAFISEVWNVRVTGPILIPPHMDPARREDLVILYIESGDKKTTFRSYPIIRINGVPAARIYADKDCKIAFLDDPYLSPFLFGFLDRKATMNPDLPRKNRKK